MTDRLEVDPGQLRKAAARTAAIEQKITTALATLKAHLDSRNSPWGNDNYGHKFADDADSKPGYLTMRDNLLKGTQSMADTFAGFTKGQKSAADSLGQTDTGSATTFKPR
ncbi:hypothetical protein [Nocardia heshunensis]